MSNTPMSTRQSLRSVKHTGSPQESGSGKKQRTSIHETTNDDVLPPKHVAPASDIKKRSPVTRDVGLSSNVVTKEVTPASDIKKRSPMTREGTMAESGAKKKRKSVRRSSFVRGRISMAVTAMSTPQLSCNIPQDLPEDMRLQKLSMTVLEHTLEKLSNEFPELEGMQQFEVLARDAVDRTVESLKRDGTLASLTVSESRVPNPVNVELENTIKTYEEYIDRLKTESQGWDSLVELRSQMAEDANRAEIAAADDIVTEPVAPLSAEQEAFLSKKPNYTGLLEELKSFREQALLAATEILEGTNVMDRLMEVASVVVLEQAHLLHLHSFESIKNFDSPRTLLDNVD